MSYELQEPNMTTYGTATPNSYHQVQCTHFQQDALTRSQASSKLKNVQKYRRVHIYQTKQNRKEIDTLGFTAAESLDISQ